jgi:hypothetical protein
MARNQTSPTPRSPAHPPHPIAPSQSQPRHRRFLRPRIVPKRRRQNHVRATDSHQHASHLNYDVCRSPKRVPANRHVPRNIPRPADHAAHNPRNHAPNRPRHRLHPRANARAGSRRNRGCCNVLSKRNRLSHRDQLLRRHTSGIFAAVPRVYTPPLVLQTDRRLPGLTPNRHLLLPNYAPNSI